MLERCGFARAEDRGVRRGSLAYSLMGLDEDGFAEGCGFGGRLALGDSGESGIYFDNGAVVG